MHTEINVMHVCESSAYMLHEHEFGLGALLAVRVVLNLHGELLKISEITLVDHGPQRLEWLVLHRQ